MGSAMHADELTRFRARVIFCLGGHVFFWGVWLFQPFFSVFDQAPVYDGLSDFMSEELWGLNAMLAGAIMLYGGIRPSHMALLWGAAAGAVHWTVIGTYFAIGDYANTAALTTFCLALLSAATFRSESTAPRDKGVGTDGKCKPHKRDREEIRRAGGERNWRRRRNS